MQSSIISNFWKTKGKVRLHFSGKTRWTYKITIPKEYSDYITLRSLFEDSEKIDNLGYHGTGFVVFKQDEIFSILVHKGCRYNTHKIIKNIYDKICERYISIKDGEDPLLISDCKLICWVVKFSDFLKSM